MTNTNTNTNIAETAEQRLTRLGCSAPTERRMKSLTIAHGIGVSDDTFRAIADACRLGRGEFVRVPAGRYDHLSRGRGWCRGYTGEYAGTFAEKHSSGDYTIRGTGKWIVGSTDGFSREKRVTYRVRRIAVGDQTWIIAE